MKVKFDDIATFTAGQSPESKFYSESEGMPFMQGNRTFGTFYPIIDTYTTKVTKMAHKGEILMSVRAPVGDLNFAPCDLCIGRGLSAINAKNGDNAFLFYALKFNIKTLLNQSNGTTYDAVTGDDIRSMDMVIPDDKESYPIISHLLHQMDEKIANNNAICSNLEAMAKLLYDYWFVQFDFPDENGKPYKSSGGKMVWNDELKREIPVGWKVSHLGEKCEILLGGTPDTSKVEYWDGDIPWLNSGEVAYSPVLSAEKTITKEGMNNSTTAFAEAGAVVMSITRYIRPSILGIDACFNQSVVAVKPTKMFHTSYLFPLMKSNVDRYMKLRTGAQQPHINKGIVENTLLLCPSETTLNEYYKLVEDLYAQQMNISKESQQIVSLRDFLLPMLMNGQVKVMH